MGLTTLVSLAAISTLGATTYAIQRHLDLEPLARRLIVALTAIGAMGLAADLFVPSDPSLRDVGLLWIACILAAATTLVLLFPRRPWSRGIGLSLAPGVVALGAVAVSRILREGFRPLGSAALVVALVAAGLVAARLRKMPVRQRIPIIAASALAVPFALLLPPADAMVFAFGVLGPILALDLFLRDRAFGALTRPLAATAIAYAGFIGAGRFLHAGGTIIGLILGAIALVLLEWRLPELDAERARRHLLTKQTQSALDQVEPAIGTRVGGRYRLTESLGEGTFGRAFLADDEVAGGRVVVKALKPERASDRAFFSEARAMAAIRDRHVTRLLDIVGGDPAGYLIIEYMPGGSLESQLSKNALPPDTFARLAGEILAGLAAVHEAGLIHGDIKPANVLLAADGRAKLADFGVAHPTLADATLGTAGLSPAMGTLRYMAPEQARTGRATRASDIYSAAVTLFEMRTGGPYVQALPNESAVELQLRVARQTTFDEALVSPPTLAAWFARALAPDPEARFASAEAARAALELAMNEP